MTWAIKTEGLSKVYRIYPRPLDRLRELVFLGLRPHHQEMPALSDVNLEINSGTTVGIIGRNGAGKSTLLKIMSGNLSPSSGQVRVNGRVSSILELGMGFQPGLTGRQNIRINGLLLGLRPREIEACIPEVAAFSDLGDAIDRPLSTYSTGMVGRLAFSILSAVRAEVIILDEALAAGDVGFVEKGRKLIRAFRDSGSTVLLVSHDMNVVRSVCDRVVWIDHGKVQADGDPLEVVERYLKALPELTGVLPPEDRTLAPTRLLFRLTPEGAASDDAYTLGDLEWQEVLPAGREVLGRARPYLESHMLECVQGARENGLDAEAARSGWGAVGERDGRRWRQFSFPGGRPAVLALRTPQSSHGGPIELGVHYQDTSSIPLRLELVMGGEVHRLGQLFGGGDGAWKELRCPLPPACRFETLVRLETPVGAGAGS